MRKLLALLVLGVTITAACGGDGEVGSKEGQPSATQILRADPTCNCVADHVIVKFKGDKPTKEVLAILSRYGAYRIREDLNLGGAWLLWVDSGEREALLGALQSHQGVEYAERDYILAIP